MSTDRFVLPLGTAVLVLTIYTAPRGLRSCTPRSRRDGYEVGGKKASLQRPYVHVSVDSPYTSDILFPIIATSQGYSPRVESPAGDQSMLAATCQPALLPYFKIVELYVRLVLLGNS